MSRIIFRESAAPTTPASGQMTLFADTNGDLSWLDDGGNLTKLVTTGNATITLPNQTDTIAVLGTQQTFTARPIFSTTIGVGGATPSTSGSGVTFPATQSPSSDANTLDDYEEGTWTPVISGSTIAGTYQTATAVGTYTKIGNRIHIFCTVTMAAVVTGGGTGYMRISGLPVGTANAESATGAVAAIGLDMTAGYTWLTALPDSPSGLTWFFQECGDNQAFQAFPIAGIGANDSFSFSATYRS